MKCLVKAILSIIGLLVITILPAQQPSHHVLEAGAQKVFSLENKCLTFKVVFTDDFLKNDSIIANPLWMQSYGSSPAALISDGGFELNIVWTDWLAPGKKNNGDNPVILGKEDFKLKNYQYIDLSGGATELKLLLQSESLPLKVSVIYRLNPDQFYIRKKIEVTDTFQNVHYLQSISPVKGKFFVSYYRVPSLKLPLTVVNSGGFGQPFAITAGKAGAFFGVEYPLSVNKGTIERDYLHLDLTLDIGEKLGKNPLSGDWAVIALIPEPYTQSWFYDYVKDIRVAPAEPYTLYNSWYDLRSPEYPGVKPANVMNEENIMKIIDLFKKNMIDKHNIHMDAFVLDDGWDVYQSDWLMRKETLPHGLKPISKKLNEIGSGLGIWFGPTGGYSFRMKRIDWMKKNGYEVVGEGRDYSMLCLGGKKYSALFENRVTDMVKNQGVSYFKWDGIQFSCSEPDHGHPVGIFSRNAILKSLINKCNAVREINPATYLNITSGTWLSPWWVKYANQIWMDGGDFGFADVPSVNMRDAAITYRDFVLYDDFINKGLWFPVANLMTHGIIKGNLENIGGSNDPIDKFTNDVILYFARGISMYELYISPDLLNDQEWNAIGKSINWAKEKKEILAKTFMVGGNPTKGEPYAYVHFKGDKGILAVRNPLVTPSVLDMKLKPDYGLSVGAKSLVIEKVYPNHYILPRLYSAGELAEISLEGFETAIYEVYPIEDATTPLPAGCWFELNPDKTNTWQLQLYQGGAGAFFLNPETVTGMNWEGKRINAFLDLPQVRLAPVARYTGQGEIDPLKAVGYSAIQDAAQVQLMFLFNPDETSQGKNLPEMTATLDGKETELFIEEEKGKWCWIVVQAATGEHSVQLHIKDNGKSNQWSGSVETWIKVEHPLLTQTITLTSTLTGNGRVYPPSPYKDGFTISQLMLGTGKLQIK